MSLGFEGGRAAVSGGTTDTLTGEGDELLNSAPVADAANATGFNSSPGCAKCMDRDDDEDEGSSASETAAAGTADARSTGMAGGGQPQLAGAAVSTRFRRPERNTSCSVGLT